MMPRLRQLQRRFDALSLRERMLLIAAAAAVGIMVGDLVWLTPATQRYSAARAHQRSTLAAQEALRADLDRITTRFRAQAQQARQETTSMRQRTREGEEALRRYQDALVGPDQMLILLDRLLAEHGQLRVRDMRTLAREDLLAPSGNAATAGSAGPAASAARAAARPASAASAAVLSATEPSLFRHGVELTLEGGYADLLDYLRAVEALPQQVLWGGMQLRVEHYPVCVLTLRLYTISRDRHWLEI